MRYSQKRGGFMENIKHWLEDKILSLCNVALRMQDCAEDQEEINSIIALRNKMLKRIKARV